MFWPDLVFPPINLLSIWPMAENKELTPCTGKCLYNSQADACVSCGRNSIDISKWYLYNEEKRKERIEAANQRLKELLEER